MSVGINVRVASNVAIGNQDITTAALDGATPKAALFQITRCISDGVAADHKCSGFGAATSSAREWAIAVDAEHGQNPTDTHCRSESDHCVLIIDPVAGGGAVDGSAYFVQFIVNGCRIYWDNAPASAYLLTVDFFAGDDLQAQAESVALGDATDNVVDVNTVGFEPTDLIVAMLNLVGEDATQVHNRWSVGAVHNAEPVVQRCWGQNSANNQAAGFEAMRYQEDYGVLGLHAVSATIDWGGEFSAFDANGFTVTTRLNGANDAQLYFLALDFGGMDSAVITHDTPAGAGNDNEAGIGFEPAYVLLGMTQAFAVNTGYEDASAGTVGLASFTDSLEYANSVQSEDAANPSNTQSMSDNLAVNLPDDDGTQGIEATFVAWLVNGWTLNYTAVKGSACKFWALALEGEEAPPPAGDVVAAILWQTSWKSQDD